MFLRNTLAGNPSWITTPIHDDFHDRCNQDAQHSHRAQVLPTDQPIKAWTVASHQFDIIRESTNKTIRSTTLSKRVSCRNLRIDPINHVSIPFQTVHVRHRDTFEERDDQQGKVATEIVE